MAGPGWAASPMATTVAMIEMRIVGSPAEKGALQILAHNSAIFGN